MHSRCFLAALSLGGLMAGCHDASVSVHYQEHGPAPDPEVHVVHVCTPDCLHYYEGDRVIVIRERHRHGPGCGHYYDGRHWVIHVEPHPEPRHRREVHKAPARHDDPGPPPRKQRVEEHRHGPDCGCVFDRAGSKWVAVERGHVHGPNCGHVRVNGRWVIRR